MSKGAGWIVLFGSGETSPSGRKAFDWLMQRLTMPVGVAIVETPAGFELNSAQVAGRVGDFLKKHLQNYRPQITVVPARKRGTLYSPDSPEIAAQIIGSDLIFLGPGSPTYAARQLRDSVTWYTVLANQRLGSALVLASAAAIASGALALPVYEIYKVGQDLHWQEGLDLFAAYGLSLVFVPHWNNRDGGVELDTSRCYMGQARFEPLLEMLPPDVTVVGIDEGTALAMHMESGTCHVLGQGGVTVLGGGGRERFEQPATFSIDRLGSFRQPVAGSGLPAEVWHRVKSARSRPQPDASVAPSPQVLELVEEREHLRANNDWPAADALRDRLAQMGWQVLDTPSGPRLEPLGDEEHS
ncbi:MAG: cysteinyl-tRNA synthetase [Anaerolineae bacterium]|jgi:hypothetical protein